MRDDIELNIKFILNNLKVKLQAFDINNFNAHFLTNTTGLYPESFPMELHKKMCVKCFLLIQMIKEYLDSIHEKSLSNKFYREKVRLLFRLRMIQTIVDTIEESLTLERQNIKNKDPKYHLLPESLALHRIGHQFSGFNDDTTEIFLKSILGLLYFSVVFFAIFQLTTPVSNIALPIFCIAAAVWTLITLAGLYYFAEDPKIDSINQQLPEFNKMYRFCTLNAPAVINRLFEKNTYGLPEDLKETLKKKMISCYQSNIDDTPLLNYINHFIFLALDASPEEMTTSFAKYCSWQPRFSQEVLDIFNDVLLFRVTGEMKDVLAGLSVSPEEKNAYLLRAFKIQALGLNPQKPSFFNWFKGQDSYEQLMRDIEACQQPCKRKS